ncbi:MAG: 3'(2'),5'-bisphosphate nucleotidase [Planctomycetaceae bacterium]
MAASFSRELTVAQEAVRHAARLCRNVQASITPGTLEKKDKSPVTVADFASQAVICRAIGDAFPHDPIIGEEDAEELRTTENSQFLARIRAEVAAIGIDADVNRICEWIDRGGASDYSPRFWTLDPIDGTKGFLRKEQFAISLALIVEGNIEVALLGCPNLEFDDQPGSSRGVLYYATRGGKSWKLPLDQEASPQPIRVSSSSDASASRFCESVESGHSEHGLSARAAEKLGIGREPLRMDSQAKYAVVADGRAEIYMRLPAKKDYKEKIWDHVGGVLLVEEAGGIVTDVLGRPLEFTHGKELLANRGVIATNGKMHDRVLAALAESYRDAGLHLTGGTPL